MYIITLHNIHIPTAKTRHQHTTKHPRLNSEAHLTPVTFRPLVEEREEK